MMCCCIRLLDVLLYPPSFSTMSITAESNLKPDTEAEQMGVLRSELETARARQVSEWGEGGA